MKKVFISIFATLIGLVAMAQDNNAARLLVQEKWGNIQGFLLERVDSVYFDTQDYGRVAADVQYIDFTKGETGDTLWLSATRTENCAYYRLAVLPKNNADRLADDQAVASYFAYMGGESYYSNFTNAQLTGMEFSSNADYAIITLGYDKYNIPCHASRADFRTPAPDVAGNPVVEWSISDITTEGYTIHFTPNADVKEYYFCQFLEGDAESQFEMWGPMFGLSSMGDMIKLWGIKFETEQSHTYTGCNPGTNYEIYIQPVDANGEYAPMIIATVTTSSIGGEGEAIVTMTLGEFKKQAEGEYTQTVIYTPNDQTALYREMLIQKATYETEEWGDEGVLAYLKTDRPNEYYWDFYQEDAAPWTVDPSTEYISFALARNSAGEWGPLARLEFTTPADADASTGAPALAKRKANPAPQSGRAPKQAPKPFVIKQ